MPASHTTNMSSITGGGGPAPPTSSQDHALWMIYSFRLWTARAQDSEAGLDTWLAQDRREVEREAAKAFWRG